MENAINTKIEDVLLKDLFSFCVNGFSNESTGLKIAIRTEQQKNIVNIT